MQNRDKEIRRLMAEKGVNFDDLSERLNNFPEPSSAKDIEDKLAKLINPQPQFTLMAEEVKYLKDELEFKKLVKAEPLLDLEQNLLNRIKQWNEHHCQK